jgi:hypothetical protein
MERTAGDCASVIDQDVRCRAAMREGVALIALREVNRLRLNTDLEPRSKLMGGSL